MFITAEGLLMYLQPDDALGLITECARRFPGGQMMFDLPPPWFAALGAPRHADLAAVQGAADAVQPLAFAQAANLVNTVPGIRAVHDLPLPAGRGKVLNALMWTMQTGSAAGSACGPSGRCWNSAS